MRKASPNPVDVTVFVFTDMVVIARQKKQDAYQMFKAPIPLESAVFLDKADVLGMKNVFQLIYLQQEIHTLQARSKTDKITWLNEAEDQRAFFCSSYINLESNLLRAKAETLKNGVSLSNEDTIHEEEPEIVPMPPPSLRRRTTMQSVDQVDHYASATNLTSKKGSFHSLGRITTMKRSRGEPMGGSSANLEHAQSTESNPLSPTGSAVFNPQRESSVFRFRTLNRLKDSRFSRSVDMAPSIQSLDDVEETEEERRRSKSSMAPSEYKKKMGISMAASVSSISSWLKKKTGGESESSLQGGSRLSIFKHKSTSNLQGD